MGMIPEMIECMSNMMMSFSCCTLSVVYDGKDARENGSG